jgi:hypothetical protein
MEIARVSAKKRGLRGKVQQEMQFMRQREEFLATDNTDGHRDKRKGINVLKAER